MRFGLSDEIVFQDHDPSSRTPGSLLQVLPGLLRRSAPVTAWAVLTRFGYKSGKSGKSGRGGVSMGRHLELGHTPEAIPCFSMTPTSPIISTALSSAQRGIVTMLASAMAASNADCFRCMAISASRRRCKHARSFPPLIWTLNQVNHVDSRSQSALDDFSKILSYLY